MNCAAAKALFDSPNQEPLMVFVARLAGARRDERMSPREVDGLCAFIKRVMRKSGFGCDSYDQDYVPFRKLLNLSYGVGYCLPWRSLYNEYRKRGGDDAVPRFKELRRGECYVSWGKDTEGNSRWTQFTFEKFGPHAEKRRVSSKVTNVKINNASRNPESLSRFPASVEKRKREEDLKMERSIGKGATSKKPKRVTPGTMAFATAISRIACGDREEYSP